MIQITPAWVLSLMVAIWPQAKSRWGETYPSTAEAMAESANMSPLFEGNDGPAKTAAVMIAVSWYESAFNPKAIGDGGHSFCLGQINDSNFRHLQLTKTLILSDVRVCVKAMSDVMRESFRVCKGRGFEELLGHYAVGGNGCPASEKGRGRMRKAQWLFAQYPYTAPEK